MVMLVERAPLHIHDSRDDDSDDAAHAHALATITRAMRFTGSVTVERVDVYLQPRGMGNQSPEWLENRILVRYINPERNTLVIGAIQRTRDSDSEFHS